jgi:hypothetical protein
MGRQPKISTKAPEQPEGIASPESRIKMKAVRRNRSKKRRPDTVPGLIAALREDTIDLRTRTAQDVLSMRDSLARAPEPTVKALVRDALAVDGVIMARIAAELVRPDANILDEFGQLHPLITKFWPEIRAGVLKSGKALLDMEKGRTPATDDRQEEIDLTTLIVAAQAEEGGPDDGKRNTDAA